MLATYIMIQLPLNKSKRLVENSMMLEIQWRDAKLQLVKRAAMSKGQLGLKVRETTITEATTTTSALNSLNGS
jgi:hypothetical protein